MLEQVNNPVTFYVFFVASKQGKTGLTVTVDVYRSGASVVTAASATEVGGGLYKYQLASGTVNAEGEYVAIFKTADATVDAQHLPSLWVVGKAGVEDLDATISSRSSHTAADVWGVTTRTLSAFSFAVDLSSTALAAVWDRLTSAITTAGSIGKLIKDNLDAAVSSRSSYAGGDSAGTTTLLSRLTAGRAANLDNLDAAVTSRSSHTAADVWAVTTRTLSSFGTLVSDGAAAVWGAAARTLTGFSFTVNTNANATETAIKAKTDNLPLIPAAQGDAMSLTTGERSTVRQLLADALNSPLPEEVAASSVNDYVQRSATQNSLSGVFSRLNDVDGALDALDERTGQMDLTLLAVKSKTDRLGAAVVTVQSPVVDTGRLLMLVAGDDYLVADGRQFDFEVKNCPDLTGASVKLTIHDSDEEIELAGQVLTPTGDVKVVRFEASALDTRKLPVGTSRAHLIATLSNESVVTLAYLRVHVTGDYTRNG